MRRDEKQQIIEELTERFGGEAHYYLADTSGLTVEQVNKLRALCHSKGVQMKVAKNTFIQKALQAQEADLSKAEEILHGPTSIFFSETANLPAKIIKDYRKKSEKPVLKAAIIGGADVFVGDNLLDSLSALKSKEELIGDIIGLLQSPAKNVIGALQSGGQKLSGIVKTLGERAE